MAAEFDLVVRNGTIIDGTDREPQEALPACRGTASRAQPAGRRAAAQQKAEGYRAIIVGGAVTYRDGAFTFTGAPVRRPAARAACPWRAQGAVIETTKKPPSREGGLSKWLRGQDLNLRPSGYEPDELPGCSTPRQHVPSRSRGNFLVP